MDVSCPEEILKKYSSIQHDISSESLIKVETSLMGTTSVDASPNGSSNVQPDLFISTTELWRLKQFPVDCLILEFLPKESLCGDVEWKVFGLASGKESEA